ncbi:Putative Zinc finger, RING-type [Septoria linicola]|uniref:Zinc finger, RING-type n=1 Tax=Septoria linicola TaxID=215465 RepID=A0A9Q9AM58_9PEZI|nr:putative Zinc finger, RING-type [Septoria linicola]USW51997.1 Putative Zinc finger, RING-type [Septoria linicola]
MSAIEGFTEAQNAALEGVVVGNLIFIQKLQPYDSYDSEEDHEDEEEESENEGDGSDDDQPGEDEGEDSEIGDRAQHGSDEPVAAVEGSAAASDTVAQNAQTSADEMNDQLESTDTTPFAPTMFMVVNVTKDDTTSNVTEINLVPLQFSEKISTTPGSRVFHIYGSQCEASHHCVAPFDDLTNITDIASGNLFSFMVNPSGDYVRGKISDLDRCIEGCTDGFLDEITRLPDMIKDYEPEMLLYEQNVGQVPESLQKPLCPVCMGADLLREQQALQNKVMTSMADFGEVVEYYGRLSRRRTVLATTIGGYRYIQFDERKWGHGFTDMQSDEDLDGDELSEYEDWDEANDPNRNVQLRPASEETLAALPRKKPSEVTLAIDQEKCCIDQEGFQADSLLVELPCGHFSFHEDCILTWLRQFSNCPICRKVVADDDAEEKEKERNHTVAMRRMSLKEALKSLGFEESINIREVDTTMLEIIFSTAREDRAGWRTETAIARLQAEFARAEATTETDQADGDEDDAGAGEEGDADREEDAIMSDE